MGARLPSHTKGLINVRLTLATLAADDHGDINVKLTNVNNLNQCCESTQGSGVEAVSVFNVNLSPSTLI